MSTSVLIRLLCRPLGWLNLGVGSSVGVGSYLLFLATQPKGYVLRHRGEEFKEGYVVKSESKCCVASLSTYNCGKYQGLSLLLWHLEMGALLPCLSLSQSVLWPKFALALRRQ